MGYGLGLKLDQRCKRYKQCNILPENLPKFGGGGWGFEVDLTGTKPSTEYP